MDTTIPLLVICGPTASGKTDLAIALARKHGGEIVSADSMQVYRGMDIGTAKPTLWERNGVPHHLIDIRDPEEDFSVAEYTELARKVVCDIHARGKLPILAGGTGLYIHTFVNNIRMSDAAPDPALRAELEALARDRGNEHLWELLRECDPALAEKLHPNNSGRVVRALEVYRQTGIPMSEWQRRSREQPSEYRLLMIGLDCQDRQALYARIDRRVDSMMEQGLLQEASRLRGKCGKTASQAIGYKELEAYFDGSCTLDEAVDRIKQETRRYAKRQMTWLRRDDRIRWLCADRYDYRSDIAAAAEMLEGWETLFPDTDM